MQKIFLGDSYKLIKGIGDKTADFILIDPPYLQAVQQGTGAFGVKKKLSYKHIQGISNGFDLSILDDFVRILKKINICIFCSKEQIIPLLDYFVIERGCYWTPIRWIKDNVVPTCNNKYLSDSEYCLFFREKGVKLYGNCKTKKTYYISHTNVADKKKYGHPTPKPLELIKNLIINSTLEGDLVIDTFSGSGTTAVACKELNRRCIAIENNKKYYKSSVERLEAATVLNVKADSTSQQKIQF